MILEVMLMTNHALIVLLVLRFSVVAPIGRMQVNTYLKKVIALVWISVLISRIPISLETVVEP